MAAVHPGALATGALQKEEEEGEVRTSHLNPNPVSQIGNLGMKLNNTL
jgi:hypothetical protein